MKATLKFRLQRYDLFYDIRFHPDVLDQLDDAAPPTAPVYREKLDEETPHAFALRERDVIPDGAAVLDLGCSTGYVARELARRRGCRVVGVDLLPPASVPADVFTYHVVDLERERTRLNEIVDRERFDVVLMLDVLEHLATPELFLLNLSRRRFAKIPVCVASTGNVAFVVVRLMLLLGFFNYGKRGILDITHKRLFSLRTFENLLGQTGFVIRRRVLFPFPFRSLGVNPRAAALLERLNRGLIRLLPSWFAYQVMFVATPLQPAVVVLDETMAAARADGVDPA